MHQFHFDPRRRRLFQRLAGFLSPAEAEAVRDKVAAACASTRTFTMVADLSDYPPQSQAVNKIGEEIAAIIAGASPAGLAIVTGSALQRLRLRRVMEAARPSFFDTVESAADALGWEAAWLAALISPPDTPPAAGSGPPARR